MSDARRDDQLEFFDVTKPSAPPRRTVLGIWQVQIRHDQAILGGIAALIGLTVVFAMGVERGKQLAHLERALLPLKEAAAPSEPSMESEAPAGIESTSAPAEASQDEPPADSRRARPAPSAPKRMVPERSRYAIQVVTYSRPQLARRELERLHEEGEPAFLAQRQGHTVLYIGPFPSKVLAQEKVTFLKDRYGDCFVRVL